MTVLLGDSSRSRRFRRCVEAELRRWASAMLAGGLTLAGLGALWALGAIYVRAADLGSVIAYGATAIPYFLATAALLLVVFISRGVAAGSTGNLHDADQRARKATIVSLGLGGAFVVALAFGSVANAQEAASAGSEEYCQRNLGTWFYCHRKEPPPPEQRPDGPLKAETPPEIAELEAFRKELEEAMNVATWNPTPANIERWHRLQQVATDKGSLFADQVRRLLWTRPDLDYTIKRPVNQLGVHNFNDERSFDRDLFIRAFASEIGLFYVFRESCGACQTFNPIIRDFAQRYALDVKAVSTDGSKNPYFRQTLQDRGQLKAWGITQPVTPALLLYQSPSVDSTGRQRPLIARGSSGRELRLRPCLKPQGCLTYIGAGVISQDDIAERLYVLLATEPGSTF